MKNVVVAKMETTTSTCKDSLQVGNAAKMREALKMFVDAYKTTSYTLCIENLRPAFQNAKAALSSLPRNCDLFGGDPKMLYTAWFDWTASPSGMNDDGTVKLSYGEWLLERAKGDAQD